MALITRVVPAVRIFAVSVFLAIDLPAHAQAGGDLAGVGNDLPLLAVLGAGILVGGVLSALRTRKR